MLQPPKLVTPRPFVFHIPTPAAQPKPDASKVAIVCGLTLLPVDPMFDAAMRKGISPNTKFSIATIQPSICTRTEP
jgi:hypothetical protein